MLVGITGGSIVGNTTACSRSMDRNPRMHGLGLSPCLSMCPAVPLIKSSRFVALSSLLKAHIAKGDIDKVTVSMLIQ